MKDIQTTVQGRFQSSALTSLAKSQLMMQPYTCIKDAMPVSCRSELLHFNRILNAFKQ